MVEKTCGSCYWFTKIDKPVSQRVTHYCKLHYMQEARRKNEKACNDWWEVGGLEMISWRDKEPTQKQLDLIAEIQEFSNFPLPDYKGTTRGEAHDWIQQNWKAAHESSWAIEHGYE